MPLVPSPDPIPARPAWLTSSAPAPSGRVDRARVLCVVDREEVARAYEAVLRRARDLACAGTVSDLGELAGAVERFAPAVLLVDLVRPDATDFGRIAELRARRPEVAVVVVQDGDDAALLRSARASGARGYVLGCLGAEAALASVRAVLEEDGSPGAWARPTGAC